MDTVFWNSKNSKTSDPHWLLCDLAGKRNLKKSDKYVALSNLSVYYTWKYIKKSYKNNKFKTSAPTWNKEFEFTHCSLRCVWSHVHMQAHRLVDLRVQFTACTKS